MKCTKCGYLGFEDVERCRNCGYDFSLSPATDVPELKLRRHTQRLGPLGDLPLGEEGASEAEPGDGSDLILGDTRVASGPTPEFPLFERPGRPGSARDESGYIPRPSAPRPPLAVRRATPEIPRMRGQQPRGQSLELGFDRESADVRAAAPREHGETVGQSVRSGEDASLGRRLMAAAIDLLILAAIDVVVVYFTMQICGLTAADLDAIPKGPLLAFLLVQNGGYLVAFTAGGQTLGKMAAGIKVVPADSAPGLDFGQALLRTALWVVLVVPAGLGFLTAMFSSDHRGLHDRFAGTRVVRATAA